MARWFKGIKILVIYFDFELNHIESFSVVSYDFNILYIILDIKLIDSMSDKYYQSMFFVIKEY